MKFLIFLALSNALSWVVVLVLMDRTPPWRVR